MSKESEMAHETSRTKEFGHCRRTEYYCGLFQLSIDLSRGFLLTSQYTVYFVSDHTSREYRSRIYALELPGGSAEKVAEQSRIIIS